MGDISISGSNTERIAAELINRIQTEMIDAGAASEHRIVSAVEHSAANAFADVDEAYHTSNV